MEPVYFVYSVYKSIWPKPAYLSACTGQTSTASESYTSAFGEGGALGRDRLIVTLSRVPLLATPLLVLGA